MTIATAAKKSFVTVGELMNHLGGIPSDRVRLLPTPGTATENDVARIHARENKLYELLDGILVEKPMGYFESHLACVLIQWIGSYLDGHDLGVVAGEAGMVRLSRGLVRIPDVSFVSWEKLPGRKLPAKPIPDLVPDLAVEVISPTNTDREMQRKLDEYFASGVRLVWFVYPEAKLVRVFRSRGAMTILRKTDTLEGGDILPGFAMPLKKLFARPRGREHKT